MRVKTYPNAPAVAAAAADYIAAALNAFDGPASFGVAGGATPLMTYEELAVRDVAWEEITMWLGDERWVAHHHPESNVGMVRTALVEKVNGQLIAPNHSLGDPEKAAAAYELALDSAFVDRGHGPAPDIVLLGIGGDGHTASLFPGSTALDDLAHLYVANWVEDLDTWRLTATFPLLWQAAELIFIVTGAAKAGVLREIMVDGVPYPAQRASAESKKATWFLDHAAAAELDLG